ncbi:hypothetical protein RJT34_16489 [Clitoria ternatea]|uniref:Uncharacterized protein n=1 Tax=Clitoria ternatea TaxID=43366 RepID=A0AAN9JAB7_CLITE
MVMEASTIIGRGSPLFFSSSPATTQNSHFLVKSMATPKPIPPASRTVTSRKNSTLFPLRKQPRSNVATGTCPIKLLTRMKQLKPLSKVEKAGLLSAVEKFGFSLSAIERLELLSKAEELCVICCHWSRNSSDSLNPQLGIVALGSRACLLGS